MKQLPASLSLPVHVSVRNSDLGLNERGTVARLDTSGLVACFPVAIAPGVVLFTTLDMRSINATARGLIRVISARGLGEGAGFETVAEFVELNEDGREKLERLLGSKDTPQPAQGRSLASDQMGLAPVYQRGHEATRTDYQVTVADKRSYFDPAPLRGRAQPPPSTKFWNSLGLVAYLIAAIIVIALFPKGRALEAAFFGGFFHGIGRLWYWA
ncbi:MAG: hypothetical protein GIW99_07275, partial [Candidatus Eremiobacteraeota bacterium]|nr:hypothetical protein [Candidatus Eremiobacteraeota bacterium]